MTTQPITDTSQFDGLPEEVKQLLRAAGILPPGQPQMPGSMPTQGTQPQSQSKIKQILTDPNFMGSLAQIGMALGGGRYGGYGAQAMQAARQQQAENKRADEESQMKRRNEALARAAQVIKAQQDAKKLEQDQEEFGERKTFTLPEDILG